MAAIIYLTILAVAVAFAILYRDMLALLLLITVVAIPLLSLLMLTVTRLLTRVSVELEEGTVTLGQPATVNVKIKNRSPFSISRLRIALNIKNRFIGTSEKQNVDICVPAFSSSDYKLKINSEHIGVIEAKIKRAAIYGFFGVASFGFAVKGDYKVTVCPPLENAEISLRQNMYCISESNVFSKHKPGDDPSEVFRIRDFEGGDKLNRIHWKLSTKQDTLMVKDYSLPVSESVLLLAELSVGDKNAPELADEVIKTVFSLSNTLLSRKIVHSVGWYSCDGGTVAVAVETGDDLFAAMGLFLQSAEYCAEPRINDVSQEWQQGRSHVVYVAPEITEKQLSGFLGCLASTVLPCPINVLATGSDDKTSGESLVLHCGDGIKGLDGAVL